MKHLPDLSNATAQEAVDFLLNYMNNAIPNSSTRLSLGPEGYPEQGEIEQTIRSYQQQVSSHAEAAVKALETGCGNCQEFAYAGALILRMAGYPGAVSIGQFGINHQFMFVDDLIVDPWAGSSCLKSDWQNNISAYGGSVKEGVMRGRVIPSSHEELEDDVPEEVEIIPNPYASAELQLHTQQVAFYKAQLDAVKASDIEHQDNGPPHPI